jgi:hypothetical protein
MARTGWSEIRGNTFSVKEELKRLGARWNPEKKVWEVKNAQFEAARKLVDEAADSTNTRSGNMRSRWIALNQDRLHGSSSGCSRCRRTSTRTTQIWETCDSCGAEPIYI